MAADRDEFPGPAAGESNTPDGRPQPAEELGDRLSSSAASKLEAREDGTLDVMASIGGVRGLAEASLPAAAFLIAFLVTEELGLSLIVSVALGALFAVARLVQRGSLVQSLSGLVGILICAWVAHQSGDARDFYLWGFITNSAYTLAFLVSIAVRWPFLGILFGLVRGEGLGWRHDKTKRRRYALATWIVIGVMVARLLVQVPLYLADSIAALGAARLVMGIPIYALALWIGWMITRPTVLGEPGAEAAADRDPPARDG